MQQELIDAVQTNGPASFTYSRTNGSGLWVPKFTDQAGNAHQAASIQSFQMPPSNHMSGNGHADAQMWQYDNMINDDAVALDFKEEDGFGMDME